MSAAEEWRPGTTAGGAGLSGEPTGRRGPKPLGDVLGALFAARGLGGLRAGAALERAWADAVGEPACRRTRVDGLRRGVLAVIVAHPALLEELSAFRKPALLAALRAALPETPIHDLRFRVGRVEADAS